MSWNLRNWTTAAAACVLIAGLVGGATQVDAHQHKDGHKKEHKHDHDHKHAEGEAKKHKHAKKNMPVSKSEQAALTPEAVLDDLMAGNKRYVAGKLSKPNVKARISASAKGQFPQAVILSCLDSRVPVEQVFDQGIGDIFVGRVAGNVENVDQLGSMEFATKVAGSKLVMVLGHEACGAVKGACAKVQMGNLTALLEKLAPAVDAVEGFEADQRTADKLEFVNAVVRKNVEMTVADIRERSEILTDMEKEGEIKIVGAVYSLADGAVTLLD